MVSFLGKICGKCGSPVDCTEYDKDGYTVVHDAPGYTQKEIAEMRKELAKHKVPQSTNDEFVSTNCHKSKELKAKIKNLASAKEDVLAQLFEINSLLKNDDISKRKKNEIQERKDKLEVLFARLTQEQIATENLYNNL